MSARRKHAGFTVIELLVVCAIIIVVTAMVLVNNNKFGGSVTLENFAYDVALSVRQAQVYGIAVERFGTGCTGLSGSNTGCFNNGYGMDFSMASPSQYVLFADLEGTGVYDPQFLTKFPGEATVYPQGENQNVDTIQQGYQISNLCVVSSATPNTCTSASQIDILYIRPEPEAYISANVGSSEVSCYQNLKSDPAACFEEAQITLRSPRGDTRTIVIDATGQISVQLQ